MVSELTSDCKLPQMMKLRESPSEAKILGWTAGQEDEYVGRLVSHNEDVMQFK